MDVDVDGSPVQAGHRHSDGKAARDMVTLEFTQSDLGVGNVEAAVVRDSLCVGGACMDMPMLAAVRMTERPFRYMPSDGIIGLGLLGLSAGPTVSFPHRLFEGSTNVCPQFGLALGVDSGELHLGSHDLARLAAPLRWFPVDHPEMGLWQVAIQAVRVGNVTVDDCRKGCHGVVDSAVSRLGVQANKLGAVWSALTSGLRRQGSCQGPDLTFDLGDMSLTLKAEDYTGTDCVPLLGSLDLDEPSFVGVYALGATVLRKYYAAFDWDQRKLGFAPFASGMPSERSSSTPEQLAGELLM